MEKVLPRDMVCEILGYLNNKDLYVYGSTSKTSMESADILWKKKMGKDADNVKVDKVGAWCMAYKNMVVTHLSNQYEFMREQTKDNYIQYYQSLCLFLFDNPISKSLISYVPVYRQLEETLEKVYFDLDFEMFEWAHKYLALFFPRTFEYVKLKSLYPEDDWIMNDGRDELYN